MKQLIKEITALLIIIPISLGLIFFAMQKAESSRQTETLSATIEKKELNISSPVFGSIESFPVEEGSYVKANDVIAVIKVIDKKESSQFNSATFTYNEASGSGATVTIKSPVDAVVFKKELAEKSTIKPEGNLVTLYPSTSTQIKVQVDPSTNVKAFDYIYLTDAHETHRYDIDLSSKLPISNKDDSISYYATLKNSNDAKDFYNGQKVLVKAKNPTKALTGKVESFMASITKKLPFNF